MLRDVMCLPLPMTQTLTRAIFINRVLIVTYAIYHVISSAFYVFSCKPRSFLNRVLFRPLNVVKIELWFDLHAFSTKDTQLLEGCLNDAIVGDRKAQWYIIDRLLLYAYMYAESVGSTTYPSFFLRPVSIILHILWSKHICTCESLLGKNYDISTCTPHCLRDIVWVCIVGLYCLRLSALLAVLEYSSHFYISNLYSVHAQNTGNLHFSITTGNAHKAVMLKLHG